MQSGTASLEDSLAVSYKAKYMIQQSHSEAFTQLTWKLYGHTHVVAALQLPETGNDHDVFEEWMDKQAVYRSIQRNIIQR